MSIQNWPKWITASINQHVDTNRQGLKLFYEGQNRETFNKGEFAEVRVTGPQLSEISNNYWRADVIVNILIQSSMTTNLYKIHNDIGIICVALAGQIPVYKYGDGNALFDCLQRIDVRGSKLIVRHFGQIAPDIKVQQATVEAVYRLECSA